MEFKPLRKLYHHLYVLVEGRLWVKVIIGLFLGIITGILLGPDTGLVQPKAGQTITSWLALPGNIFIRLVQMIMIPLIISSIIQGIAGGENKEQLKSTGPKVGFYFLITTVFSIVIGLVTVLAIKPGNFIDTASLLQDAAPLEVEVGEEEISIFSNIPGAISNILPSNPLQSMVSGEMLSIVIFSIIVGIALISMKDETANPLMDLLFTVQEICMTVTRWAMVLAPFAVFGLIAQITARVGFDALTGLGMYILTVILGLLILMCCYLTIVFFVAGIKPFAFLKEVRELLLLAFSMASSAAVMPLSMKTVEENFKVTKGISRFVIPVGATINMNGTALYQAIATIFLAQVYGLDLNIMSIILLVVTTVAASVGTPSSPGAGIIILATVLSSVGIPIEGIAMIIGVDNLLGMSRTAVNVTGDITACLLFQKWEDRREADGAVGELSQETT